MPVLDELIAALRAGEFDKGRHGRLTGLKGSAGAYLTARLAQLAGRPIAVLVANPPLVSRWLGDLQTLLAGSSTPLATFPGHEEESPARVSRRLSDIGDRTGLDLLGLRLLVQPSDPPPLWVLSKEALAWRPPEPSWFIRNTYLIRRGGVADREELARFLEDHGYVRKTLVERRGDYAVRGFVVDIFPPLSSQPVRVELAGDAVDDLREFDSETQRSIRKLDEVSLFPPQVEESPAGARVVDLLPGNTLLLIDGFDATHSWPFHSSSPKRSAGEDAQQDELRGNDLDKPLHRFTRLIFEPLRVLRPGADPGREWHTTCSDLLELRHAVETFRTRIASPAGTTQRPHDSSTRDAKISCRFLSSSPKRSEGDRPWSRAEGTTNPIGPFVRDLLASGTRCVFFVEDDAREERLRSILARESIPFEVLPTLTGPGEEPASVTLIRRRLHEGFIWEEARLALVPDHEVFGAPVPRLKQVKSKKPREEISVEDLREGDFVVHVDYGVGLFRGAAELTIHGVEAQYLKIEYAEEAIVYLPVDRISLLEKYVGSEGITPKLDRLGTAFWRNSKEKLKEEVKALAKELAALYARRESLPGHAFPPPDDYLREFEAAFPHEETPDQREAIEAVYQDLSRQQPMDRLVCGDVGYGKTEVALRAAFHVAMNGKQVAVLVPTTLLAYQHFQTFERRLKDYPLKVRMLSRFVPPAEQKRIVREISGGAVDMVIGTHRLLSADIAFPDLGLLVVDEEHRFGVLHKEKIKKIREKVDVLTLTATPIPRTLHLALLGIRDLTTIATPPQERKDIMTYVAPHDDSILRHAIEEELDREGQVFCVHPRIRGIWATAEYLEKLVPSARLGVAHGKMKEDELEKVLMDFVRKDIDVLLSTSIIEAGLDIPNANTIIVFDADHFGLAQLYQLRGRVGRSGIQAKAYLIVPEGQMTPEAVKRLEAVQESGLGSGYRLAKRDLEIRGGGDVLGKNQSGHIARMGFHTYLRLIEEAVRELKGQPTTPEMEPEIRLPHRGSIPEFYVEDMPLRIYFYRKCARAGDESVLDEIRSEMIDRFGSLPEDTTRFFHELILRLELKRLGIVRLVVKGSTLTLHFDPTSPVPPDSLVRLVRSRPAEFKLAPPLELVTSLPKGKQPAESAAEILKNIRRTLLPEKPPAPEN
ncbi:MAG: transcription-repair coupling factor [Nitrospirae bacterium]|nr:transcription-repair coupling factor [Nitrospirota bacterium]